MGGEEPSGQVERRAPGAWRCVMGGVRRWGAGKLVWGQGGNQRGRGLRRQGPKGLRLDLGSGRPPSFPTQAAAHPSKGDAGRSTAEGAERMHDAGSEAKELTLEEAGPAGAMK